MDIKPILPPIRGWNSRDALSAMSEDMAVELTNWFPSTQWLECRPSYAVHVSDMQGRVETLIPYNSPDANDKLFASVEGNIYDVTSTGTRGAAELTGLSNARFQYVQVGTVGGQFLIAVNGETTPIVYDGSSWSTASITGPTAANLVWVNEHQNRVWFGEKDSLNAWYLPVNQYQGTASKFLLPASLGGYIVAMGTWSRDGGAGMTDIAVFITSQGEVLAYAGTDPDTSYDWQLINKYNIAPPIGRRCFFKLGPSLYVITEEGALKVDDLIRQGGDQNVGFGRQSIIALTDQIRTAFSERVTTNRDNFGWQAVYFGTKNMLMINTPISTNRFEQFAFNTQTGAPTKFTIEPSICWAAFGRDVYFGSNGHVYKFNSGKGDNGTSIVCTCQQAYTYLDDKYVKTMHRLEPVFTASDQPTITADIFADYISKATPNYRPINSFSPEIVSIWDTAVWDSATWSVDFYNYNGLNSMPGKGRAFSLKMSMYNTNSSFRWLVTNYGFTINYRT